ncbi:MAG: hypothetical protein HHAS10_03560 [Candidatus Altimarinota bacterium]
MAILHFGEHHNDALDSRLKEYTERMGSKAGILEYLRTFPELKDHILPGFLIDREILRSGNIPNLPPDFQGMEEGLIYRSTHPDDHRGYIGALPTELTRYPLKTKTIKDLDHKTTELFKVYRALAFFQEFGCEMRFPKEWEDSYQYHHGEFAPPSNRGFLVMGEDEVLYETDDEIPMDMYIRLLSGVKEGTDTTNYKELMDRLLSIGVPKHVRIIEGMRQKFSLAGGFEFDGLRSTKETGIYIQVESPLDGSAIGGISESPHRRGVYIITFRNPTRRSEQQRLGGESDYFYEFDDHPSSIIYDSNTGETIETEGYSDGINGKIPSLVELYKKVQKRNVFGEDYSFHMEFGFHGRKPLIYQVRQFGPYRTPSFSLENEIGIPKKQIVRGLTDASGEKIRFILSGGSQEGDFNARVFTSPKHQLKSPKLREIAFAAIPFGHRTNDDHGLTTLLYETGGVAVSGGITMNDARFGDERGVYEGIIYSDGSRVKVENLERVS